MQYCGFDRPSLLLLQNTVQEYRIAGFFEEENFHESIVIRALEIFRCKHVINNYYSSLMSKSKG